MKLLLKSAMVAGLLLGASTQPVLAQSSAPVAQGIAIANLDAVVANSNAYKAAEQQQQTTYKSQIDSAEAKRAQIQAQLKPMVDKFNADRSASNPNQSSLAQQAQSIQQIQERGQQELQQLLDPVARSRSYVNEQINDKLDQAIKTAMTKKNVSLLLSPEAILAVNNDAYNLNQDILNELNALLPSVQVQPPQGWEPRQVREARAQQQQQATVQQGSSTTAGPQPQGR